VSSRCPDLDHLESLARAATPGPWRIDGRHDYGDGSPYGIDCIENESGARIVIADCGVYPPHGATAEYIAALSPDVVLKLIADQRRFLAACNRTCDETDWCPVCEHHPSSGHFRDCPLAAPDRRKAMSDRFTFCPYCDSRISPGQDVVGVDDPDPDRSLWHRSCRKMWERDEKLGEVMSKASKP
jgi:hypothetical protein